MPGWERLLTARNPYERRLLRLALERGLSARADERQAHHDALLVGIQNAVVRALGS